jgi:hypothetical protein
MLVEEVAKPGELVVQEGLHNESVVILVYDHLQRAIQPAGLYVAQVDTS